MKLSAFGEKFSATGGISALMDDLGAALTENPSLLFMGGGNPGRVEAVQELFSRRVTDILAKSDGRHALLGTYQSPQGDPGFRREFAAYLRARYGWDITEEHVAVANGSQTAFFVLANLFAGMRSDGSRASLHFPMSPEYVGYGDIGLCDAFFTATKPGIERLQDGQFKYHIDFDSLAADPRLRDGVAGLCVSRPSNPTGNVIADEELGTLDDIARQRDIPLIVDAAYGEPFPGLVYGQARPLWNDNTILMFSLSKLGLPGVRTGVIVARPEITRAFARANTVVSLATGTLGPQLLREMLTSGRLDEVCRKHLKPFYARRRDLAMQTVARLRGDLPVWMHRPEGAFFLWLWCEDLPIDSRRLYERLKERGVIVLPGNDFFIGLDEDWQHRRECLRISYAGEPATIEQGLELIMHELHRAYGQRPAGRGRARMA